jgi:(S)-sulfolactate dehydrogenase
MRVVIAEFMDEAAVAPLQRRFVATYDASLSERRDALLLELPAADALIVRKRIRIALDVVATEPLPAGSTLADCPNLLLTARVAGVTRESNQRLSLLVAERVAAALAVWSF